MLRAQSRPRPAAHARFDASLTVFALRARGVSSAIRARHNLWHVGGNTVRLKTAKRRAWQERRGEEMNRSMLVLVSLFVFSFDIRAQDSTKSIEDEIRNAKESTVVTILNSRQLLLSKIKANEFDKVSELIRYLDSSIDTSTYAVLFPFEKVLIDILIYRFVSRQS